MIRLCFLLGSAMVSIRLAQPNTRTLPSQSQKQLSTHTDGQMTNLLDTLTIYRSVVSLSPEEAGLTKCCESPTLTPHLDLLVILARDMNAWFSYASKTIFSMLSDSKDFPPCLPEAKAPTNNRGGGGGPPSPPSPPSPPPQSSPSAPDSPSNTQATHHHHRPRPTSPPGRGLHPTNPTSSPVPLPSSDAYVGERNQPSAYQPPPSEQTHLSTFARAHEPMSYPKAAREDYRVTSEQRLMQRRLRLRRQRKLRRRRTVTRMKMRKKQRRFKRGQKDAEVTSLQLRKSRADRHFGPGFWLLLGLSVGFGAAFVCHSLLGRKEVVPVILDDSEEHPHEGHHYWRKKRNQTGHNRRAWVNTSDNVYDRNESVSKRIRRLRSHLYRRRRQEIQYAVDLFPIDSGAIANSSESAKSQDLGSSNSSNQTIRDDRDVLMMVDDLVRTLPRSILKNGSKGRYRRRHGRKGKKGKGKRHHANDEVISLRRPRPGVEFATSSGSSETSSGELLRPVVDRVRPDGMFWDDSDEYSEAHSVGKLRSGATSTCSSLRDELTGPWVSTSHSFVVYDLDVIDDIPNEVMEVLCCDEQTCDKHPHDRYHYVGNKIIVQRLPLPGANNGRAGITAFLPNLNIPPLATSTPKKTAIISEVCTCDRGSSPTPLQDRGSSLHPDLNSSSPMHGQNRVVHVTDRASSPTPGPREGGQMTYRGNSPTRWRDPGGSPHRMGQDTSPSMYERGGHPPYGQVSGANPNYSSSPTPGPRERGQMTYRGNSSTHIWRDPGGSPHWMGQDTSPSVYERGGHPPYGQVSGANPNYSSSPTPGPRERGQMTYRDNSPTNWRDPGGSLHRMGQDSQDASPNVYERGGHPPHGQVSGANPNYSSSPTPGPREGGQMTYRDNSPTNWRDPGGSPHRMGQDSQDASPNVYERGGHPPYGQVSVANPYYPEFSHRESPPASGSAGSTRGISPAHNRDHSIPFPMHGQIPMTQFFDQTGMSQPGHLHSSFPYGGSPMIDQASGHVNIHMRDPSGSPNYTGQDSNIYAHAHHSGMQPSLYEALANSTISSDPGHSPRTPQPGSVHTSFSERESSPGFLQESTIHAETRDQSGYPVVQIESKAHAHMRDQGISAAFQQQGSVSPTSVEASHANFNGRFGSSSFGSENSGYARMPEERTARRVNFDSNVPLPIEEDNNVRSYINAESSGYASVEMQDTRSPTILQKTAQLSRKGVNVTKSSLAEQNEGIMVTATATTEIVEEVVEVLQEISHLPYVEAIEIGAPYSLEEPKEDTKPAEIVESDSKTHVDTDEVDMVDCCLQISMGHSSSDHQFALVSTESQTSPTRTHIAAVNTDDVNTIDSCSQTSLTRFANLLAGTDPAESTEASSQTSPAVKDLQPQPKKKREQGVQTVWEPRPTNRDAMSQTAIVEDIPEISEESSELQEEAEDDVEERFPSALLPTPQVPKLASRAASVCFTTAMETIRKTYELCMTSPSSSPSPKKRSGRVLTERSPGSDTSCLTGGTVQSVFDAITADNTSTPPKTFSTRSTEQGELSWEYPHQRLTNTDDDHQSAGSSSTNATELLTPSQSRSKLPRPSPVRATTSKCTAGGSSPRPSVSKTEPAQPSPDPATSESKLPMPSPVVAQARKAPQSSPSITKAQASRGTANKTRLPSPSPSTGSSPAPMSARSSPSPSRNRLASPRPSSAASSRGLSPRQSKVSAAENPVTAWKYPHPFRPKKADKAPVQTKEPVWSTHKHHCCSMSGTKQKQTPPRRLSRENSTSFPSKQPQKGKDSQNASKTTKASQSGTKQASPVPEKSILFKELKEKVAQREFSQHEKEVTLSEQMPERKEDRGNVRVEERTAKLPQSAPVDGKKEGTPSRICIEPEQSEGSGTPQRVCFVPSKPVKKICISVEENCEIKSPHRPRINSQQKENTPSPQRPFDVDTEDNQSPKKLSLGKLDPAQFFKKKCEPCVKVFGNISASELSRPLNALENTSRRPAWGNVEQVFESQRSRSNDAMKESVTPVPHCIQEAYERCMAIKAKQSHQTKASPATSPSKRPGYERFDGGSPSKSFSSMSPGESMQSSASPARDSNVSAVSEHGGHFPREQNRLTGKTINAKQEDDGSDRIPFLPLAFPFPGSGNRPPSDQDSSNSAERGRSDISRPSAPASPDKNRQPYKSLSKVSMTEASPPWELSDRARNSVFSPVGWTSPRSGITSLFRGQSHEEMAHVGQSIAIKDNAGGHQTNQLSTSERPYRTHGLNTYRTTREVAQWAKNQAGIQQSHSAPKLQTRDSFYSLNESSFSETRATGLRSTVKSQMRMRECIETALESDEDTTELQEEDCVQQSTTSTGYRPRIRTASHSPMKSRVPVLRRSSLNRDPLPSKPNISHYMSTSLSELDFERVEREIGMERKGPQQSRTQGVMSKSTKEALKSNANSKHERHKCCMRSSDINEELKSRLRETRKPSQIKKGKRKRDSTTVTLNQIIQSHMTAAEFQDDTLPPQPKPRSRLPVSTQRHLERYEESDDEDEIERETDTRTPPATVQATVSGEDFELQLKVVSRQSSPQNNDHHPLILKLSESALYTTATVLKQYADDDRHEVKTVSSSPKVSRIPVVKARHAPVSQMPVTSVFGDDKKTHTFPTMDQLREDLRRIDAYNSLHETLKEETTSKKQSAIPLARPVSSFDAGANSQHQGVNKPKQEHPVRLCSKGSTYTSKLPVPHCSAPLGASTPDLSKLNAKKALSPMISSRIRQLQQSIMEKPNPVQRETRPIRKLTSYLEDEPFEAKPKAAKAFEAGDLHKMEMKPTATLKKADSMKRSKWNSPRKAAHGELIFMPDSVDMQKTNWRRPARPLESCRFSPHTGDNISQNHNANDSSCDVIYFIPQSQDHPHSSPSCSSSCSDISGLSMIELVTSSDEEDAEDEKVTCGTPSIPEISFLSTPTFPSSITEEINHLMLLNEGLLLPSLVKKCSYSRRKSPEKTETERSSTPSHKEDGTNDQKAECTDPENCLKHVTKPYLSLPTNTHTSTNYRGALKRCRSDSDLIPSYAVNIRQQLPDSMPLGRKDYGILDPNALFCSQYVFSCTLDIDNNDTLDDLLDSSFLSIQCLLLGESNSPEAIRVIGSPQANSSFMEDSDYGANGSDAHDVRSNTDTNVHHGPLKKCLTEKRTGGVGSSVDSGLSSGSNSHASAPTNTQAHLQPCYLNGACEYPITGSRDVMSTFLATLTKQSEPFPRRGMDDLDLENEEARQGQEVANVSRDLRFYGHSSFLELGVAWALQHTVNRISSKGDNIANVNLNGLNTADAARTDIKNASF